MLNEIQLKQSNQLKTNRKLDTAAGMIEFGDIGAIFSTFLSEFAHQFFEETGKYFMFPIAALAAVIRAVLAWRHAMIEVHLTGVKQGEMKTGNIVRAIVETITSLAVITAVVGALAFAAVLGAAAPWIFAVVLGAKALFHAGAAAFYWGKSTMADDSKKQSYRDKARSNAVSALAIGLAASAVYLVMLAGHTVFAIAGISAAAITAVYGGFKLYKEFSSKPVEERGNEVIESSSHGSTLSMLKNLVKTPLKLLFGVNLGETQARVSANTVAPIAIPAPLAVARNSSMLFAHQDTIANAPQTSANMDVDIITKSKMTPALSL